MRIIFMGSPDFAIPSLKLLCEAGENIEAVVTQPDRKGGRGLTLLSPPVKIEAERIGFPVYQPERIREKVFIDTLNSIKPDVIVVVAYGQILPREILEIPKYGCINLHGSLLPKYRGAAPIQWAIINGEKKTGVTTILMDTGMDTGEILLQEEIDIAPEDTAGILSKKLSSIGAGLLLKTIKGLEMGTIKPRPQDHSSATYAPLLKKEDGRIDWSKGAEEIRNLVRGMNPWPAAYTFLEGKLIKIWDVDVIVGPPEEEVKAGEPGRIIHAGKNGILVSTGKDSILIKSLQLEGKQRTTSIAFLQGHKVEVGSLMG
jgi:methionyl-tRNA formyltransferase